MQILRENFRTEYVQTMFSWHNWFGKSTEYY